MATVSGSGSPEDVEKWVQFIQVLYEKYPKPGRPFRAVENLLSKYLPNPGTGHILDVGM